MALIANESFDDFILFSFWFQDSKFASIDLNCKRVMILDNWLFQYGKVACTDVKNKQTVIKNEQVIQDCGAAAADQEPFQPK